MSRIRFGLASCSCAEADPVCFAARRDTFAVSAALGMRGLPPRQRLRVSRLMSSFEMAMPVVGLLRGRALGRLLGSAADYVAVAR
jgi:putative Mn2+ efflux pump MntP